MGGSEEDTERRVRRLRKKLLQIERLEAVNRELNEEECIKVNKKVEVRAELNTLIKEAEMKRSSESGSKSPKKVAKTEGVKSNSKEDLSISHAKTPAIHQSDNEASLQTADQSINQSAPTHGETSRPTSSASRTSQATSTSQQTSQVSSTSSNDLPGPLPPASRPEPPQQSEEAKKKLEDEKSRHEFIKSWRRRRWRVEELEGHEDLILDCDIDLDHQLAVTASRDTTLKTWDLSSGCLLHSLRGHTGPVTGCQLTTWRTLNGRADGHAELPLQDTAAPRDNQLVCVSGSTDCSLKVWSVDAGSLVKSIYTFNGISKLKLIHSLQASISGTDGGKLEMYSLTSGNVISSVKAHQDSISALSVLEGKEKTLLGSGSTDGIIKIFTVDSSSLSCIYVSENVTVLSPNSSLHTRPIYSIYISESEVLYYGDNGHNIKMLDWKHNQVVKFSNHTIDHGFTDSISGLNQLIVSTSFDIDTGFGQLNIYSERLDQIPQYLATLSDNSTNRISVLKSCEKGGKTFIMTAGVQLKAWESSSLKQTGTRETSSSVQGCVLALGDCPVLDSGSEDGGDTEDEEINDVTAASGPPALQKPVAGFCNCTVM